MEVRIDSNVEVIHNPKDNITNLGFVTRGNGAEGTPMLVKNVVQKSFEVANGNDLEVEVLDLVKLPPDITFISATGRTVEEGEASSEEGTAITFEVSVDGNPLMVCSSFNLTDIRSMAWSSLTIKSFDVPEDKIGALHIIVGTKSY